ncbi:heparinase II/III domain-containing protein [Seonamhaeicola aphaedonensis]|uniref:Heparinase II/III-like protein n=1 Tax=Seonamhaeicola aphaedonensis TaxID=1461338 RepID=A0A3D9HEB7_9FLAO|nr:heparinase II/III family protein [Seonamhaeicola aphaedonensis]RED47805.1 heparinase II/III-like protein [Seonamhaeicola aphaedonensis]
MNASCLTRNKQKSLVENAKAKSMNTPLIFLFLVILSIHFSIYAQRDFLVASCTPEELQEMLVMDQKWVIYPDYSNREAWDNLLGSHKVSLIENGEAYLDYEWQVVKATDYLDYSRTGNRQTMQDPYFDNQDAISALILAELAEGKGRFLDQIIDGIFMNCEMTSWVLSAHFKISSKEVKNHFPDVNENLIGLYSSQTGAMLSWAHYFFKNEFDKVNPLISDRIQFEVKKRILEPYMNMNYWWTALPPYENKKPKVNNWNPWCNANLLQCFMLMENDKDKLAKAVYRSMQSVDMFINEDKDGACDEGPGYWGVAAGKMYDYLSLLEKLTAGKISIFDKPEIKAMAEYVYRANVGKGWVVNFSDASAKSKGNPYFVYGFGKAVASQDMMQFAAYLKKENPEINIAYNRDIDRALRNATISKVLEDTTPVFKTPEYSWYPKTEYCFMSNEEGLFLATKGGYNQENHNHNDVGSFMFYVNATPIFIDTGVGSYTAKTFGPDRYTIWTMQSNYHNVPMINGVAQSPGAIFKATNTRFNKNKKTFTTDISKAYPESAEVTSWIRNYQLKKDGLTIKDKFSLSETLAPNQLNFMTWGKVNIDNPGKVSIQIEKEKIDLFYNEQEFSIALESIPLNEKKLSGVWGATIYRLTLTAKSLQKEGEYTFQIKKTK